MPIDAELLTGLGAVLAIFLSAVGSAYASGHAGIFAVRSASHGKNLLGLIPIIISGVLAIYGIIVAILLVGKLENDKDMTLVQGYRNLSGGLAIGLTACASGFGISIFMKQINEQFFHHNSTTTLPGNDQVTPLLGNAAAANNSSRFPSNFLHIVLSLVFLEAIGLYGLIVALFLIG